MNSGQTAVAIIAVFVILGLGCTWKAYVWKECLKHNSFVYCMFTLK